MKPIDTLHSIRSLACVLVLALCLPLLVGCASWQEQKPVATCGDYEILYEELRFVTLTHKDRMSDTYGEDIWKDPDTAEQYRAELEEAVYATLKENYMLLVACNYYRLTREDLESDAIQDAVDKEYDAAVQEYESYYSDDFEEGMEALYLTENLFRFYLAVEQMKNELFYVLARDLQMIEDEEDVFYDWLLDGNCAYVQHVFICNDEGDDPAINRIWAEEVQASLASGRHTVGEYIDSAINEDTTNTAPYYIVRDVYEEALVDAALALGDVNDVSPVVEADGGYYVFVRMEDSTETLLSQLTTLFTLYQGAKLGQIVDGFADQVQIEWNDYGKSLDLLTIE